MPMDASFIAFLIIISVFVVRGYKSGLIVVISRLVSLSFAYILAWLLSKPVGKSIQSLGIIDGLLAYVIAGAIVFIVSYLMIISFFSIMHRVFFSSDQKATQLSAFGGAVLGGIIGLFAGVLAIWFSTTLQTVLKNQMGKEHQPSKFEKIITSLTRTTVRGIAVDSNEAPELTSLPAVILADPSQNINLVKRLTEKRLVQDFFADEEAQRHLNALSPGTLLTNESFKRLIKDKDFKQLAEDMNFSSSENELEEQIAMQLATTWAKVRLAQNDPQFQVLLEDPELKILLDSKNILKLATSSKVEELMSLLSTIETPEIRFERQSELDSQQNSMKPAKKETKIYRWVDENGKVHYSDKKPDSTN